jgi:transposase
MTRKQYSQAFRNEAVRQVVDLGHPVEEVSKRLGISSEALKLWLEEFHNPLLTQVENFELQSLREENARLKEENARLKKLLERQNAK